MNLEIKPVSPSDRWRAVLERDRRFDGAFVYAVRSTGIYCRPSCPSRKPAREKVAFFPLAEVAEQAGYRPCKRCRPQLAEAADPQAEQMRAVCRFIEAHLDEPLTLASLSEAFHYSPSHLQRTFKRVVGISPQQYLEACRMKQIRGSLQNGEAISEALYEAGWNSPSRLYSRTDSQLGMTPQTYQQRGVEMEIRYTIVPSPLGQLLVAATERGICAVRIGDSNVELEEGLHEQFGGATIGRDDAALKASVEQILAHLEGRLPHLDLPLDVQATAFQKQVWAALQAIPYGETRTYGQVAQAIGRPSAVRAVAGACAANPAALVVPCHRVIGKDGSLTGYRWGVERKEMLLQSERGRIGS